MYKRNGKFMIRRFSIIIFLFSGIISLAQEGNDGGGLDEAQMIAKKMNYILENDKIYEEEKAQLFTKLQNELEHMVKIYGSSKRIELKPTYMYKSATHVANGASLRNRTSCTIALRGVPIGSRVVKAFLYFNFMDEGQYEQHKKFPVLFNGNLVDAIKTASSADPCWYRVSRSHTYRADVTPYVLSYRGHPNQDYNVVLAFNRITETGGRNPWDLDSPPSFSNKIIMTEGATLIVIYRNKNTNGPICVYDNLNEAMFSNQGIFILHHPLTTTSPRQALFTMAGADGQIGFGFRPFVANEKTFFNGNQIAGRNAPSFKETASDWDGSDGWPLPQLWDTHTHKVNVKPNPSIVRYKSYGDCLLSCVFVMDFIQ
jgi:hypothetical protein